jgi:hypothetical protein
MYMTSRRCLILIAILHSSRANAATTIRVD